MVEILRQRLAHLWAKSPPVPTQDGYPLFQHTLDVCWQAEQFFRSREPQWPLANSVDLARILAYAALLHDFGKAHRDFQRALRPPNPRFRNRHEILSLAFLSHLQVPGTERPWLVAAIASHHKGLFELFAGGGAFHPSELFASAHSKASHLSAGIDERDWQTLTDVLEHAVDVFRATGWPPIEPYSVVRSPKFSPIEALYKEAIGVERFLSQFSRTRSLRPGRESKRDWPSVVAAIYTRGFVINSDHLASFGRHEVKRALTSVGDVRATFQGRIATFNSFQQRGACCRGNAVLVGPTGSGKTEAALLWAAAQAELSGRNGRVLFTLPYQASMNAMQERLVCDLFPEAANDRLAWNAKVSLAHGRSIRKTFEALLNQSYEPAEAAALAKAQEELARLHASPILISSAFSLIRLILASRGAEGLWAAMAGSRIVVDEIHAYEPAVTAMILASLRFLIDHLGASALIMSATMPRHLMDAIGSAIPDAQVLPGGEDVMDQPARHRLRLAETDALSDEAFGSIRLASVEQSVLVVLNQVRRATALFERLRTAGSDVILLHSRFNYQDRSRIEGELLPKPGRILVATQAVEVSLNVSFAECFSELAPLESLQQRFGRCNRRGELGRSAPVTVFAKLPSDDPRPYDKEHLSRVLELLRGLSSTAESTLLTEKRMAGLLDESYPDSLKSSLKAKLSKTFEDISKYVIDEFTPYGPRDVAQRDELEQQWQALFDGEEVLPDVLLGQIGQDAGWLERARYMVPVPSRWLRWLKAEWNLDLMCFVASADYSPDTGLKLRR